MLCTLESEIDAAFSADGQDIDGTFDEFFDKNKLKQPIETLKRLREKTDAKETISYIDNAIKEIS